MVILHERNSGHGTGRLGKCTNTPSVDFFVKDMETTNQWYAYTAKSGLQDSAEPGTRPETKTGEICPDDVGITAEEPHFAISETRAVNILRLAIFVVLLVVAIMVSFMVFFITRNGDVAQFEEHFLAQARKLLDDFSKVSSTQLTALKGLSLSYTSHVQSSNETFPFVTLPDIELRGRNTIVAAELISLAIAPIVLEEEKDQWLDYSKRNKRWIAEGLALQQAIIDSDEETASQHLSDIGSSLDLSTYSDDLDVTPFFFRLEDGIGVVPDTSTGMVMPLWQMAPAIPHSALVNFNLFSQSNHKRAMEQVINQKESFVGPAFDFSLDDTSSAGEGAMLQMFLNRRSGQLDYEGGPVSSMYVPVFDKNGSDREVKAVMIAYVYWQSLFTKSLPDSENSEGIICVIENNCGQSFTFQVDGSRVFFLGPTDLHDSNYDNLALQTEYKAEGREEGVVGACEYRVRVFPSKSLEDIHMTSTPRIMTTVVVIVFIFTSIVFIIYDFLVQRRHNLVNKTAMESTAVVDSLFPSAVRSRVKSIYNVSEKERETTFKSAASAILYNINEDFAYDGEQGLFDDSETKEDAPIAELYPDCTISVCDIAGFSQWSNGRLPGDVFMLLELVYGSFDKLAKKCNVFTIEATAEGYVAATGMPEPQLHHAVTMCWFASACIARFEQIIPHLANRLGDDTFDLSLRFGLHSGSVTAGVLRSEKARFQLYGESFRVAAAMRRTADPWQIQVSAHTSSLLREAGKHSWLTPREGAIRVRGVGKVLSYWVKPPTLVFNRGADSSRNLNDYSNGALEECEEKREESLPCDLTISTRSFPVGINVVENSLQPVPCTPPPSRFVVCEIPESDLDTDFVDCEAAPTVPLSVRVPTPLLHDRWASSAHPGRENRGNKAPHSGDSTLTSLPRRPMKLSSPLKIEQTLLDAKGDVEDIVAPIPFIVGETHGTVADAISQ